MVMVLARFCRIEVLAFGLVAIIIICSMYNNTKIMKKLFPGNIWYISLLVLGILMGICNYFWGDYSIKNIVKDIVYCSMPLLYWLAGENIVGVKKNINKEDIYRVLFVIGTGFAVYDLCHSILIILKNGIGDGNRISLCLYGWMVNRDHECWKSWRILCLMPVGGRSLSASRRSKVTAQGSCPSPLALACLSISWA